MKLYLKYDKTKTKNKTYLYGKNEKLLGSKYKKYNVIGYLHIIYDGINNRDLEFLASNIDLPEDLVLFYKKHNGINLFSNTLKIYGLGLYFHKDEYIRSNSLDIMLPYNLMDYKSSLFGQVFGKIGDDYSIYYNKNKYIVVEDKSNKIKRDFKKINDLLDFYIESLEKEYDKGVCKEPLIIKNILFNKPKIIKI